MVTDIATTQYKQQLQCGPGSFQLTLINKLVQSLHACMASSITASDQLQLVCMVEQYDQLKCL